VGRMREEAREGEALVFFMVTSFRELMGDTCPPRMARVRRGGVASDVAKDQEGCNKRAEHEQECVVDVHCGSFLSGLRYGRGAVRAGFTSFGAFLSGSLLFPRVQPRAA
jgi:hypothetical protein